MAVSMWFVARCSEHLLLVPCPCIVMSQHACLATTNKTAILHCWFTGTPESALQDVSSTQYKIALVYEEKQEFKVALSYCEQVSLSVRMFRSRHLHDLSNRPFCCHSRIRDYIEIACQKEGLNVEMVLGAEQSDGGDGYRPP